MERDVDLPETLDSQIDILLEHLVPGSSAPESMALLAAPWSVRTTGPVT